MRQRKAGGRRELGEWDWLSTSSRNTDFFKPADLLNFPREETVLKGEYNPSDGKKTYDSSTFV